MSVDDPAAHTWSRPSARQFVAEHLAGDAYVYLNYGVHWLFNVLVKGDAAAGFVLLRALEPGAGIEQMRERRQGVEDRLLAAGPGRLTRAFGINGAAHGARFLEAANMGIFRGTAVDVCVGGRIGISKATEKQWRFGDPQSAALSRKF